MRKPIARTAFLLTFPILACCSSDQDPAGQTWDERPNIVLILVDDLGHRDLGANGSPFYETPHIDRLAREGVLFTAHYNPSPVCSPTRAALLTGRHPARLKLTNWIGGEQKGPLLQAEYRRQLPLEEVTIAEALKPAGYASAHIGKWHLGKEAFFPEQQGFDLNVAGHQAGQPGSYFHPYRSERLPWSNVPGLEDGREGEYLTDRLTREAIGFVEENRGRPFFLMLSLYAVHTPLQGKPELVEKYRRKAASLPDIGTEFRSEGEIATTKLRQDHAVYAAMIESVDQAVGRLLGRIQDLDLSENTIVLFTSDNGGLSTLQQGRTSMPTSNLPLRAGKGWLYEGGIRSPLIVKWPGRGASGVRDPTPASSLDLYPTILEMAALQSLPDRRPDGTSLAPLLTRSGSIPPRDLHWHFPHYHGSGNRPSGAILSEGFKLIEWFEDDRVELYDLGTDEGETRNLAGERPERAEELRRRLRRWRARVGANMPTPNPSWE